MSVTSFVCAARACCSISVSAARATSAARLSVIAVAFPARDSIAAKRLQHLQPPNRLATLAPILPLDRLRSVARLRAAAVSVVASNTRDTRKTQAYTCAHNRRGNRDREYSRQLERDRICSRFLVRGSRSIAQGLRLPLGQLTCHGDALPVDLDRFRPHVRVDHGPRESLD